MVCASQVQAPMFETCRLSQWCARFRKESSLIMSVRAWIIFLAMVRLAPGAVDFWDLPPIRYSDTKADDSLTRLAADLASGAKRVEGATGLERLRFVLKELNVPEASQMLVFSKTSHQNSLIHPKNPRALYFSEEAYVGYVPGGAIEAVVVDPRLGPVFYLIEAGGPGGLKIERDLSNCMSCHGTARTENRDTSPVLSLPPCGFSSCRKFRRSAP